MSADPWDGDPRNPEYDDLGVENECTNCGNKITWYGFCCDFCKDEYFNDTKNKL